MLCSEVVLLTFVHAGVCLLDLLLDFPLHFLLLLLRHCRLELVTASVATALLVVLLALVLLLGVVVSALVLVLLASVDSFDFGYVNLLAGVLVDTLSLLLSLLPFVLYQHKVALLRDD